MQEPKQIVGLSTQNEETGESEHFIFVFKESTREEALRMFGRFASDPELNLTWRDAAALAARVRDMTIGSTGQ